MEQRKDSKITSLIKKNKTPPCTLQLLTAVKSNSVYYQVMWGNDDLFMVLMKNPKVNNSFGKCNIRNV